MKTVTIATDGNGGYVVEPATVNLGGDDSHEVDWKNKTPDQAILQSAAWKAIFANPPADGQIIVGGNGHAGPKPPLELLAHKDRQNGTFAYTVTINDTSTPCEFNIHP